MISLAFFFKIYIFIYRHVFFEKLERDKYLIDKHRFLFRLYGLHLHILTELYCLFLWFYCKFQRKSR